MAAAISDGECLFEFEEEEEEELNWSQELS